MGSKKDGKEIEMTKNENAGSERKVAILTDYEGRWMASFLPGKLWEIGPEGVCEVADHMDTNRMPFTTATAIITGGR